MKKVLFILPFILLLFACDHEKMERPLEPYTGKAIRTDGYYYTGEREIYFFFRNGTFRRAGSWGKISLSALDDSIRSYNWDYFNDIDIYYGAFWQKDSLMFELQSWVPSEVVHKLEAMEMKVQDDSTLRMVKRWYVYDKDFVRHRGSETFHFHESSFKPDSLYFERQKAKAD